MALDTEGVIATLRDRSTVPQLARGFGPLLLAALVALAMMMLLPSVAPERIVERPVDAGTPTEIQTGAGQPDAGQTDARTTGTSG